MSNVNIPVAVTEGQAFTIDFYGDPVAGSETGYIRFLNVGVNGTGFIYADEHFPVVQTDHIQRTYTPVKDGLFEGTRTFAIDETGSNRPNFSGIYNVTVYDSDVPLFAVSSLPTMSNTASGTVVGTIKGTNYAPGLTMTDMTYKTSVVGLTVNANGQIVTNASFAGSVVSNSDLAFTVTASYKDAYKTYTHTESVVLHVISPLTVTSVSASPDSAELGVGRVVTLTVGFSETVTLTGGTPTLLLNDGGVATYTAGSATSKLTFTYTVVAGQNTNNLEVNALLSNGSALRDAAGNAANLAGISTYSIGTLKVDTTPPVVTGVTSSPETADIGVGEEVTLTVSFSKPIFVDTATGVPTLILAKYSGIATYVGNASPNELNFRYTVLPGQNTADLTVEHASLNGGTIRDTAGNDADLASATGNPAGILKIDTAAPTVTEVSTSPSEGDLSVGQTVIFTVGFSEPVEGAAYTLELLLSGGGRASYAGGIGTNALTFNYTVAPEQNTDDLTVVGYKYNFPWLMDTAGNAADLSGVVRNPVGILQIDTIAPTVTSVTASPATADLSVGKTVALAVTFSELVTVKGNTLTLMLNDWGTATYTGGSGTDTLTFVYTVEAGQNTDDLEVIDTALNGSTVLDGAGNAADLTGAKTNPNGTLQIDTRPPTVINVTASADVAVAGIGQVVTITLTFSETVIVDTSRGTPTLMLNDGGKASYVEGTDTSELTFRYQVAAGENVANLTVIGSSLNEALIRDGAGNSANLDGVRTDPGSTLQIDTTPPVIIGMTASPVKADLGVGKQVAFTIKFNKLVTVTGGDPTLSLNDGGTATYASGTGTNELTFNYTVEAGQNSAELKIVGSSLSGAVILDPANNAASLAGAVSWSRPT